MSFTLKYDPNLPRQSLIEFTNATPKDDAEFKYGLYQDKRQSNPRFCKRRMLMVETEHLTYAGNNYEVKDRYPHAKRNVVALLNKSTGIAQVFDTDCYKLSPILPYNQDDSSSDEEQVKEQLKKDDRSFTAKQDDLTEVFGSHKRKQALATRQRNKGADSTTAVTKSIETMLEDGSVTVNENEEDFNKVHSILPCIANASAVEDVYPLTKLIPGEVSLSLIDEAKKFIHPSKQTMLDWQEEGSVLGSMYILSHARHPILAATQNEQVYEEYACCLQLMVCLIRTFKMRSSEFRRRQIFDDLPETAREWILKTFFLGTNKDRKMPNRMKDKCLAYATVLAWHIDTFSFDVDMFKNSFFISTAKVSTIVRALGGLIKTSTSGGEKKSVATLSLPLQFPKMQRTKRR